MSSFTTAPLQEGLPFGVRIGGLTFEALGDRAVRDKIDTLFVQHGMIVFEDVVRRPNSDRNRSLGSAHVGGPNPRAALAGSTGYRRNRQRSGIGGLGWAKRAGARVALA